VGIPQSLGTYPDTSLADARDKRDDARKLIAKEIDPSIHRKIQKAKAGTDTFEAIGREPRGREARCFIEGIQ